MSRRLDALPHLSLPGGLALAVAHRARGRLLGLAGLRALEPGRALVLPRCRSVHTAGMRFALDLVWVDRDGAPIRVDHAVRPGRLRSCRRARAVVETVAGRGDDFALALALAAGAATRRPPAPPARRGPGPG